MSKHHTHLFTYGSLMFAPVWTRVATKPYHNSSEVIQGFARYKVSGEEYPAALAKPDEPSSRLVGRVYWNVDLVDLERLDQFEGSDYERISTQTVSGHTVALYIYLRPALVSKEAWDPAHFENVGMGKFLARYPGFNAQG
jgi:gamma-glutamylcyclotransferase (GGCT)/AIG2-like uncharacterized protein YtfP